MSPFAPRRLASVLLVGLALTTSMTACSGDDSAAPPATTTTSAPPSTTTTEVPIEGGETLYVFTPEVGQCFDRRRLDPDQGGDEIVLLLDCTLPHQFQVFAVAELTTPDLPPVTTTTTVATVPDPSSTSTTSRSSASASTTTTRRDEDAATASTTTTIPDVSDLAWPGDDALITAAKRVCPPPFEPFVGIAYELSELEIGWVLPTQSSWNNGDRTVGCTIYLPNDERMAGTRQATAR